ncbi:glutamate receptor 4-like [Stegodyphus dumicola]|uniref:glutamate receptor 4-like n=1 Tax=Stegodyphus dumicola TaxID=202533 RepID=UPI0015B1351A|nr:glutamate receptor 4-like [Stegodyphus dumicola]
MVESLASEYALGRQPCDIVVTHDSAFYVGYGIAFPYTSQLKSSIDTALNSIQNKGLLGHLYRKWWIDSSECKNGKMQAVTHDTIRSFSGLLCMTVSGFLIILIVFGIQYARRSQKREVRRQQLSFEDMNLDRTLPMPPPELLAEAPPVLNLPEIEKRTLL